MDGYLRCLLVPGFRALLLRRTYPELENTHIERVLLEAKQLGAVYNKTEHKLRFANGSVFEFGHVEDDAAVSKYLSTEYDGIYFDELVTFTLHQFKFLCSRARTTKPGLSPIIRAGSNPGGTNSYWVKRYFLLRDINPNDPKDQDPTYRPENYQFIPATLDDNPHIDPTYDARLMALPTEALRRAYRYGDWDVFEGQYFSDWRARNDDGDEWHVTETIPTVDGVPVTARALPWIEVFRSIDWGYRDPGVCGWYACLPDGRLLKFQEYVFQETLASEVAKEIRRRSIGMKIRYTVADPSLWMRDGNNALGESIAETFQRHRVPLLKADNDRIQGWQRLHHWLQETTVTAGGRKVPLLQVVGSACPYTVRTIPALVADEHKLEDVKTKGTEDHAGDETRYAVMSRPAPSRRPLHAGYPIGTLGDDIQKILRSVNKPYRLGQESVRYR
jgi:hypothetical protein